MALDQLQIRLLKEEDSFEELTELLHRAYARLANMGFRYLATHQDVATTKRRAAKGECYVGIIDDRVIATVLLVALRPGKAHCEWYARPGVATLSQFAVCPELQGQGIGSRIVSFVEERAAALGASELALDTAEGATHLLAFYSKRGYRQVAYEQWDHTNYRSIILSKVLA
jgi:GNAT superfamily N-acetyltransferase